MFKKWTYILHSNRRTYAVDRFQPSTDIAGHTPVKSSVQRAIRAAVLSQWKIEPETLEAVWPRKESLVHVKWFALWSASSIYLTRVAFAQPGTPFGIHSSGRATLIPAF